MHVFFAKFNVNDSSSNSNVNMAPGRVQVPTIRWWSIVNGMTKIGQRGPVERWYAIFSLGNLVVTKNQIQFKSSTYLKREPKMGRPLPNVEPRHAKRMRGILGKQPVKTLCVLFIPTVPEWSGEQRCARAD
jgi:hypothetical protein